VLAVGTGSWGPGLKRSWLPVAPAEGRPILARSERTARHRLGSPVEHADRCGGRARRRGGLRDLAHRPRKRQLVEHDHDDLDERGDAADRPRGSHAGRWVGPRRGQTYELTRTRGGRVYVRYLPKGAAIGNRRADYTIVGTYPTPGALQVLKSLAKQPNEKSVQAPGGGIAVYSTSAPTNVYVAFPGQNVQIEVFDPSARRALRLVTTGRVAPVG